MLKILQSHFKWPSQSALMSAVKIRLYLLVLSLILYGISLTQNGFATMPSSGKSPGLGIVVFGALGLGSSEMANKVWLASPLLWLSWAGLLEPTGFFTICSGLAAFAVAGSFLFCSRVSVSEAGGAGYLIKSYDLGYWLWLISILCSFLSGIVPLILLGVHARKKS